MTKYRVRWAEYPDGRCKDIEAVSPQHAAEVFVETCEREMSDGDEFEVVAIEDSLAYLLPAETFYRLVRDHPAVARFFSNQRAARMRPAVDALSSSATGDAVLRVRAAELVRREPVCATASTTIRDAAATMAEQGVSALLIMDGDRLTGILTDRDLRSRVLAVGLEPGRPVSEVMTPDPITASPEALAFELMLAMVERMIHHVPLVADGRPILALTPRGKPLTQERVRELAAGEGVILLCGRFEGFDERIFEARFAISLFRCAVLFVGRSYLDRSKSRKYAMVRISPSSMHTLGLQSKCVLQHNNNNNNNTSASLARRSAGQHSMERTWRA